jgi:hypothetical protein
MRTLTCLLVFGLAPAAIAQPAPKYLLVVQPVSNAASTKDVPGELVDRLFRAEIGKHPELALDKGDLPKEPKAVAEKLAELKLKGYFVTVKVLESKRTLTPGQPGKRPQLERQVRLSVVGVTIPEQLVAFGGDGECIQAAEVGKKISEQEENELLSDALKDAITQAVTSAVQKLVANDKPVKPKRKKPPAPKPG